MSSEFLQNVAAADPNSQNNPGRGVLIDQRPEQRSDDDWVLHRALFLTPADRAVVQA